MEGGEANEEQPAGRSQFVAAALSSKELAAITAAISGFGKRSTSSLLAIVRGHMVCIHVTFDDESTLTFYLATAANEDDILPVLENTHLLRLETLREDSTMADSQGDL
jgi:hypothetical protein